MGLFTKSPPPTSSPLSEFIRNASAGEKKRVYMEVLARASERQRKLVESVDEADKLAPKPSVAWSEHR